MLILGGWKAKGLYLITLLFVFLREWWCVPQHGNLSSHSVSLLFLPPSSEFLCGPCWSSPPSPAWLRQTRFTLSANYHRGLYLASLQPVSSFQCSLVTLLRFFLRKPSSDNDTAQLSKCCHFLPEHTWSPRPGDEMFYNLASILSPTPAFCEFSFFLKKEEFLSTNV